MSCRKRGCGRTTVMLAALVLAVPTAARAADTVISFDDLPAGTEVRSQYHSLGVDFNLGRSDAPRIRSVAGARSGDRVLDFSGCSGEFCNSRALVRGTFTSPRTFVRVHVGNFMEGERRDVELVAFGGDGTALLDTAGPVQVTGGDGFATTLAVYRPSAEITAFEIRGPELSHARLAVDDLTFDALSSPPPALPVPPTISITAPAAGERFASPPASLPVTGTVSAPGGLGRFCVAGPGNQPEIPSICDQVAAVSADGTFRVSLAGMRAGANFISAWVADKAGQVARHEIIVQVGSGARLNVNGIEVTQGIQTLDLPARDVADPLAPVPYEGVTLVQGKRTIVRVYANAVPEVGKPSVPGVAARLYGCVGDKPLPGGPLAPLGGMRTLPFGFPAVSFKFERVSDTNAYTFVLPPGWTETGSLRLKAQIFEAAGGFFSPEPPPPATCATRGGADHSTFELAGVAFVPTRGFVIHPVAMPVRGEKPLPVPAEVFADVLAVTPVADGDARLPLMRGFTEYRPGNPPTWQYQGHQTLYEGTLDITDIKQSVDAMIALAGGDEQTTRAWMKAGNSAALDRLVHYMNKGGCGFGCGSMVVGVQGTFAGVARPQCGNLAEELFDTSCPNDAPASVVNWGRPLTSVGHELYHNLGRVHAGLHCGSNSGGQVGEAWPPDDLGFFHGIGLDPRPPYRVVAEPPPAPSGFTPKPGVPNGHIFDFMSYCATAGLAGTDGRRDFDSWTSVEGWEKMVNRLRIDCRVSLSGRVCPGDPGYRRSERRAVDPAPRAAGPELRGLKVQASDDGATVTIGDVAPVTAAPSAEAADARYRLVARDGSGAVVADVPMTAAGSHVHGAGGLTLLSGFAPAPGASSVEVLRDGAVVATRTAGDHPPTVRVLAPARGRTVGTNGRVVIRWRAADRDREPLVAYVAYSRDGGRSFKPVAAVPAARGRVSLPSAVLSHSRRGVVEVRVSDGFAETASRSARFTAVGGPVAMRITSPAPGERLAADATFQAAVDAWDDRPARLGNRAVRWFDGRRPVGRGRTIMLAGLRPGRRTLRVVGTDAAGRSSTNSVRVLVSPVRPLFHALRAPRRLAPTARRIRLRVAATVPSTLRIGRRSHPVDRRTRTVRAAVRPGAGPLRLKLTLRAGQLRSRTELVVPRG